MNLLRSIRNKYKLSKVGWQKGSEIVSFFFFSCTVVLITILASGFKSGRNAAVLPSRLIISKPLLYEE